MSGKGKAKHKSEELKGKTKETSGKAVGNEEMEAEGKGEQVKADTKQAAEKTKDSVKH